METWKDVPGTNAEYQVSSEGRVASRKYGKWRVLRQCRDGNGYFRVRAQTGGRRYTYKVHRLVALAFLGPPPTPAHEVNHKNGIKTDPRSENLEWVTRSENLQHAFDLLGRESPRGEAHGRSKLVEVEVRGIRTQLAAGKTQGAVATAYGVSREHIGRIARGQRWGWLDSPTANGG